MKAIVSLVFGLALAVNAPASTTNLISNGSFEAGTNGWILAGGGAKYSLTNGAFHGATALLVTNRFNFTNAPRQDVTAALAAATGSNWTTRFAVSVAALTTVRAWLHVTADNGAGL